MRSIAFLLLTYTASLNLLQSSLFAQEEIPKAHIELAVDPANDLFRRGESLYINGVNSKNATERRILLKGAIKQLRNYIKKFPKHANTATATYYLGASYFQMADMPNARKYFRKVINTYKTGKDVAKSANYLAYDAEFNKNYRLAANYYGIVARSSKNRIYIEKGYYRQALCYKILKNNTKALEAYENLAKHTRPSSKRHQTARLAAAHLHYKSKNYNLALPHYLAIAKEGNESNNRAEATYFSGICHAQLSDFEASEKAYNKVLQLPESKWKPHASVAIMANQLAQKQYKKVIETHLKPNIRFTGRIADKRLLIAGQAYLKLGNMPDAIDTFNQIIIKKRNSMEEFEAHYRKILCYYNLKSHLVTKQVNTFIRRYGKQFSKHPFMHKALVLQAETLFEEKSYEKAAKVYKQIKINLVAEANRPSVLYKKAWCLAEAKDHRNAIKSFSNFLSKYPEDPRNAQIYGKRAKSYLEINDPISAIKDYKKVVKLAPNTKLAALAYQSSARTYKKQGKYTSMLEQYEKLLTIEELEPHVMLNAHYWAAWGHYKSNTFKKATKHLQAAIKLDQGSYKKQLGLLSVLTYFNLKDKKNCVIAAKNANLAGIADQIPMGIYRWLGTQCYKAGEFPDAQEFLARGVTNLAPNDTPVYYWRVLAKAQYKNQQYKLALQSLTHATNLETDPAQQVNLLLYKALCQDGLNKADQSEKTAIKALKMNPSGRTKALLFKLLGDLSYKKQDYQQASINYASITEFYEDVELLPYAYAMIVECLNASERQADAKEFKTILKKQFPNYQLSKPEKRPTTTTEEQEKTETQ